MKIRLAQPSLLLLGLLVLPFSYLNAQSPAQQSSPTQQQLPKHLTSDYQHELIFIDRAPTLLPRLYQEKKFNEIKGFFYNWRGSYLPCDELILAGEILTAIETNSFDQYIQPCESIYLLNAYARELKKARSADPSAFKYYINVNRMAPRVIRPVDYDASKHVRAILLFLQSWAQELMSSPTTSQEELVFCRVIAGVTEDPAAEYKHHPEDFPRIAKADDAGKAQQAAYFNKVRDGEDGLFAIYSGAWVPTGALRKMGTFASFGALFGWRNKLNEIDCNFAVQPGIGSIHPYYFIHDDSTYFSNYFVGFYATLDYTRYFVHLRRLDLGCLAGIGVESITTLSTDDAPTINSFLYGGGVRVKYFPFHKLGCFDLIARYNVMRLTTHGGSDFSGNAWSLTLGFSVN